MNNSEIIIKEAVIRGILTREKADGLIRDGQGSAVHTRREWKILGYRVKDGEEAVITAKLWRPVRTDAGVRFAKVTSFLYDESQVQILINDAFRTHKRT